MSVKYRLDDLKFVPIVQPGAIVDIKMTGDVLFTSKRTYTAAYVTQRREIETQVVGAATRAFGSLFNDTRLIYNPTANTMQYRSMLVSQSPMPASMSTAVGVQLDSQSPIPKLRFEFRFPKIQGAAADFTFVGVDVKIVLELTPTPQRPGPSAQPLRAPQPATQWRHVIGAGLVLVGVTVVVATLVEDFFTAGAGVADDPASFAAAAASIGRGLRLMGRAALPTAAVPTALNIRMRLETTDPPGPMTGPTQ
jgi:hypothetical protein